jgi:magnesium transporter
VSQENETAKQKSPVTIKTGADGAPIIPEGVTVFFLSEIVNKPVLLKSGLAIGKLQDVAFKIVEGHYPEATHVIVHRPWGKPVLWLPWQFVSSIDERQTVVEVNENLENFTAPHEEFFQAYEQIMDKKIIDMEDREVEVVYDLQFVYADGKLFVTHVDASQSGLLRRIRLGFLNKLFFGKRESPDLVPWQYVHVPTDLGTLKGRLRLNVQREKLKDIHPVDLADIIEELGHEERSQIFDSLDTEKAADTLEEIEPRVQRELIKTVRKERIRDIFTSMTSAQLADLFSILSAEEANKFIDNLDPVKAKKVRAILSQREETIASLVTLTYLAFPGDLTVDDAFERYRKEARDRDVIMYIYVIGAGGILEGVVDIRELLLALPEQLLKDIMVKNVITIDIDDAKDDVVELFKRYYFRAMPVVDSQDHMLGVIRFKDLFIGQRSPVGD